jgi:hypothetical protein
VTVRNQDGASAAPPPNWITAFQRPGAQWSSFQGAGPGYFRFNRDEAMVRLPPGVPPKQLLDHAKTYINMANKLYAERVVANHRKRLEQHREELRREAAEEERRQKILTEIRL